MIVLGVDPHKYSITVVALDAVTGKAIDHVTVAARRAGHQLLIEWAQRYDQRLWAIEDVRQVTSSLERALTSAGETAHRVPPKLMAKARRSSRRYGKSDPIDAEAIARAALRENLPEARTDQEALDIRICVDHREDLVQERTRVINRTRWHLYHLDPDLTIQGRTIDLLHTQRSLTQRIARMQRNRRTEILLQLLRRCRELTLEINKLDHELDNLTAQAAPTLRAIHGCGPVSTARILADTYGASWKTDAQLAQLTGTAPLDASSGKNIRHRLSRSGNRRLNAAVHRIAITQSRTYPPAREYVARRRSEGKTTREAIRCLKRYIVRNIHHAIAADRPHLLT